MKTIVDFWKDYVASGEAPKWKDVFVKYNQWSGWSVDSEPVVCWRLYNPENISEQIDLVDHIIQPASTELCGDDRTYILRLDGNEYIPPNHYLVELTESRCRECNKVCDGEDDSKDLCQPGKIVVDESTSYACVNGA